MSNLFIKEILDSSGYSVAHVEDAIKLNQNESPWDIPLELKVAISERLIKTDFNRYPLAEPIALKRKIAKANRVMTDQIALAPGSNILIQALVHATCLRGKGKVLIVDPTFVVYELQAQVFGARVVRVPLAENFQLPYDAVIQAIRKEEPNIIFIPNPNAPTGNLFAKEGLYKIVKAARCLTVIDEAYYPYSNETLVDWLGEFPHLLFLRTFSKAFALAGIRLGYAMADTEVIQQLEKALMPFCVSTVTCAIADEILSHPGYVDEYVKNVLTERQKLFAELQKFQSLTAYPSDANFILVRSEHTGRILRELKHRGILVRDVSDGARLKDCLRISVGDAVQNSALLKALKEILKS